MCLVAVRQGQGLQRIVKDTGDPSSEASNRDNGSVGTVPPATTGGADVEKFWPFMRRLRGPYRKVLTGAIAFGWGERSTHIFCMPYVALTVVLLIVVPSTRLCRGDGTEDFVVMGGEAVWGAGAGGGVLTFFATRVLRYCYWSLSAPETCTLHALRIDIIVV